MRASDLPCVRDFHAAIRGQLPIDFRHDLPGAGPVRVVRLQPEQLVAMRTHMARESILSADDLALPDDPVRRHVVCVLMAKLIQVCVRQPVGRAFLMFAGDVGERRLQAMPDEVLRDLAVKIVEFVRLFDEPEASGGYQS
jgi:hypothetical protein